MRIKLPRWSKDAPILHSQLNAMAEAIERADSIDFDASSGLQCSDSPVGRTVSYASPADSVRYIQLSAALPAGNGSTVTGHGRGKLMDHKPGATATANGSLSVPAGSPDVDVYGLLTPGLKSGSVIAAFRLGSDWHYLLTLCTNASS